jgi:uncharacterized protein
MLSAYAGSSVFKAKRNGMMKNLTLLIKPASGLCNMDCTYCFYRTASRARENKIMTERTVDMLLKRIREYKPAALTVLFQGGDPTLAGLGFFRYFTENMKQNLPIPVSYGLQSNGTLIDEAFAKFFKENDFLVGISLDGNRKTNDRYRLDQKGQAVLPEVMNGITALTKNRVDFNILSVIDNQNAADLEETWCYFKKHDFRFLQFIPCIDENNGVSLSPEAYGQFLNRSFDLWYEEWMKGNYISVRHIDNYIRILMGDPPENCAMCGICGSYFVVESNGDLFPCDFYCNEEYRLGSIFDIDPFDEKEKQRAFIAQSKVIHALCRGCRYYPLCRGGCRRDRTDNLRKNRYCESYKQFFSYSADRMMMIAKSLLQGTG